MFILSELLDLKFHLIRSGKTKDSFSLCTIVELRILLSSWVLFFQAADFNSHLSRDEAQKKTWALRVSCAGPLQTNSIQANIMQYFSLSWRRGKKGLYTKDGVKKSHSL